MAEHLLDSSDQQKDIFSGHLRMGGESPSGERISFTNYYVELNGRPWLPVMGEFHYSRYPGKYWEEELLKMKACGIDIVASYVFWNHHEEEEGSFYWTGDRDLRTFIRLCGQHGLYAVIRIGPFCHGEVRNGGLPDWLFGKPYPVRSNDGRYLAAVRRLYREIAVQTDGLFYKQGGPIIGVQLENEFMASGAPWETTYLQGAEAVPKGAGGTEHMRILKRIALESGIDPPFFSCTAWDSPVPEDEFLPMLGGYAFFAWEDHPDAEQEPSDNYLFGDLHTRSGRDNFDSRRYPFSCCEVGGGMMVYYLNRPVVPPESVEAMTVVKLGSGVNLIGYYVFHGGSNPVGKRSYLNEYRCPRISYDYQAPIREFGQLAPSYRALKRQFMFLHAFGERLAPMRTIVPADAAGIAPKNTDALRFAVRVKDDSGFLFLNNYQDHVEMPDRGNVQIRLRLAGETITVPRNRGLTLNKHISAVLPFRMNLDGVRLTYATVQPLTRLVAGGEPYYFFYAVKGMEAELAFDRKTCGGLICPASAGTVEEHPDVSIVKVNPGTGSRLTATAVSGVKVHVVVLTEEQSLDCWKLHVWGWERIVLSKSGLFVNGDRLELRRTGETSLDFDVFPAPASLLFAEGKRVKPSKDGLFASYVLSAAPLFAALRVERLREWRHVVHFPQGALPADNDIFLRIRYVGDIGSAYIDGQLVNDNFNNGTVWEIGLKRFRSRLDGGEMVLHVSGRKTGGSRTVTTAMAAFHFMEDEGDAALRRIESVEAVVEYRMTVEARAE